MGVVLRLVDMSGYRCVYARRLTPGWCALQGSDDYPVEVRSW